MGQFMPSSYRYYAVDYANNNYSDLFHNAADAIFSIANYLKEHGWRSGEPIAALAEVTGTEHQQLPVQRQPSLTHQQLAKHGVLPLNMQMTPDQKVRFVPLDGEEAKEYWLGFYNFYVLTRYNTSPQYALAVYLLSQAIKDEYEKTN